MLTRVNDAFLAHSNIFKALNRAVPCQNSPVMTTVDRSSYQSDFITVSDTAGVKFHFIFCRVRLYPEGQMSITSVKCEKAPEQAVLYKVEFEISTFLDLIHWGINHNQNNQTSFD